MWTKTIDSTIRASDVLVNNGTREVVMYYECSIPLCDISFVIKVFAFSVGKQNVLFLFQNKFFPNSVSKHYFYAFITLQEKYITLKLSFTFCSLGLLFSF